MWAVCRLRGGSWCVGAWSWWLSGGEKCADKHEHTAEYHGERNVFIEEEGAPYHGAEWDEEGDRKRCGRPNIDDEAEKEQVGEARGKGAEGNNGDDGGGRDGRRGLIPPQQREHDESCEGLTERGHAKCWGLADCTPCVVAGNAVRDGGAETEQEGWPVVPGVVCSVDADECADAGHAQDDAQDALPTRCFVADDDGDEQAKHGARGIDDGTERCADVLQGNRKQKERQRGLKKAEHHVLSPVRDKLQVLLGEHGVAV